MRGENPKEDEAQESTGFTWSVTASFKVSNSWAAESLIGGCELFSKGFEAPWIGYMLKAMCLLLSVGVFYDMFSMNLFIEIVSLKNICEGELKPLIKFILLTASPPKQSTERIHHRITLT